MSHDYDFTDLANDDIRTSEMVAGSPTVQLATGAFSTAHMLALLDGLEIMYWRGSFASRVEIPLVDDSDRICFSFNCSLKGQATCRFSDGAGHSYDVTEGAGSIQYGPGRRGIYRQQGDLENITLFVRPDLFAKWVEYSDSDLQDVIRSGGFLDGHRGAEMRATAHMLKQALAEPGASSRHSLWLQGQSLAFLGLFLEARVPAKTSMIHSGDRARLMRARDRLLADLSAAPSLAQLARDVGISVPTLTRGFQKHFGTSPYALFQQERMHLARHRLSAGEPVSNVASDLGYTNASHFSAAFRKAFGLLPKSIRKNE